MVKSNSETLEDKTSSNTNYYDEALDWFFFKYVNINIYVRYTLVVTIIFILAAFITYKTAKFDYQVKNYPFPIYFDNEVEYYPKIQSTGIKNENINLSIARYLIINYLKTREEFDSNSLNPEKLNERLNYINNVSSLKVFQKYFKFINIDNNPESPLLKYRYKNSRIIVINDVEFLKNVNVPSYAKVSYKVRSLIDDKETSEEKVAEINFFMSEINKRFIDSKESINFLITNYTD
jgi:type IV secretory pathway component VirB8